MKPKINILITDLDNTLFDWFQIWHQSFTAMLGEIGRISGIPTEVLKTEIKTVHETHGTSEYAFLIEELPSLRVKHPGEDLKVLYEPAILAFRAARKAELRLYPSVHETLETIQKCGALIIGYTESLEFYSTYRIRKLDLDGLLDIVYFPPDHDLPDTHERIRLYPSDVYKLTRTKTCRTPKGETKPNPTLLSRIVQDAGGSKDMAAYVGDNLMKDIAMAQRAGIKDVWAEYGVAHHRKEYELLRRVTHWKPESVQTERNLSEDDVKPTYVLDDFSGLLTLFEFTQFKPVEAADATVSRTL